MAGLSKDVSIEVPDQQTAQSIGLVADYAGLASKVILHDGKPGLKLEIPGGDVLTGHNTICRYLAGKSGVAEQLLGADAHSQALVRSSGLYDLFN